MQYIIHGYEPERLFAHFEEISAIPRGSGNEAGIADHLVRFAQAHGLAHARDALNNVFIRKEATPGFEGRPAVLLQGHTDMVCEQNAGTEHDFLHEGLDLEVENGWLRAKGTTLGADDGAAVAIMLTLLESDSTPHPALECLFTTHEETGMDGALGFDYSQITSRTLINLDSEAMGVATVSCAGGVTSTVTLPCQTSPCPGRALRLSVTGLAGGHSGADIHLGRANAIRFLAQLLTDAGIDDLRIVSIEGGSKTNAIPRECEAVIRTDAPDAEERLRAQFARMKAALVPADAGCSLSIEACDAERAYAPDDAGRILKCLTQMPCGVLSFTPDAPELVESSANEGILKSDETGVSLTLMPRANVDAKLDAIIAQIDALASSLGGRVAHSERHPGWAYAPQSPVRDAYLACYRKLFGKEARAEAIHAGLECGIMSQRLPGLDAVSIGPDMVGIHTPDERLDLQSFADCCRLVEEMLKTL